MRQILQRIQDKTEILAEKWLESIEKNGTGNVAPDHAARAVRDLLGPLTANGGTARRAEAVAEQAGVAGYGDACFDGCRVLFPGYSGNQVAEELGGLKEAVTESICEELPNAPETEHATALVRTYFDHLKQAASENSGIDDETARFIRADTLLYALFQGTPNAVVFLNGDRRIVEANKQACAIFNRARERFLGQSPKLMFKAGDRRRISDLISSMGAGESSTVEMEAVRSGQEPFPAKIIASRVEADGRTIYQIIIVDLSEREQLREMLERERRQIREMSVTLKNVIRSVDQEKQEFMENLAHNVEIELMPALGRMSREESEDIRDDYREVIEDKLRGLSNGASSRLNSLMMKLTPTEIQVCKYIQSGQGTKEIAEMMNSSFETVQTHRKNIRKKLELTGKQISLSTFLKTLPDPESVD